MMDDSIRRDLRDLFDAHDVAYQKLRAANQAMGAAIQVHDEAIQTALHANRAALALLTRLEGGGP
jgi:hypothetical protein